MSAEHFSCTRWGESLRVSLTEQIYGKEYDCPIRWFSTNSGASEDWDVGGDISSWTAGDNEDSDMRAVVVVVSFQLSSNESLSVLVFSHWTLKGLNASLWEIVSGEDLATGITRCSRRKRLSFVHKLFACLISWTWSEINK